MTKNELIDGLLAWAGEDEENLSVMIIAGDANGVHVAVNGSAGNLLKSLAEAMRNNECVKKMCAKALEQARAQEVTKTIIANDYYDEE
ncbi:hypothetical protein [Porphyromonas asaccharolytica]|jgi:hypothetical protein|uniref:hypothetical protein n=1 Tax=Porphyromonas asaccharolytica TaxID=28123 RepID=UPI00248EB859|nr:hypothetical protein [Porphyromonas asaccharolytica]